MFKCLQFIAGEHMPSPISDFKGLDDWVPIFYTGDHTDSNGVVRKWTQAHLDEVVSNFDAANPPPAVPGHPQNNSPQLAKVADVRVNDGVLEAQFGDIDATFKGIVESGELQNRSVRLVSTDKGVQLDHVGFLGLSKPALKGLPPIEFSAPTGEFHDYGIDWATASRFSSLHEMLSSVREWIIDQYSRKVADQVVPKWELNRLPVSEGEIDHGGEFKQSKNKEGDMPEVNGIGEKQIADHADEIAKKDADFSKLNEKTEKLQAELAAERLTHQRNECASFVEAKVADGVVTPAQAEGMIDFMASLGEQKFDFCSVKEGVAPVETSAQKWFKDFVGALGKQVPLGKHNDFKGGGAESLNEQVADFMAKNPGTSSAEALAKVQAQG